MMPRAFAFDLYGTLVDYASLRARLQPIASNAAAFVDAWRAKQLQYAFMTTIMNDYVDFDRLTGLALDFTVEQAGIQLDAGMREALIGAWSRLPAYPDAAPVLAALRKREIPLAVLSNGTPHAIARTLDEAGLAEYFDAVLSVDAVRAYKPDARVYGMAVTAFDLPREDIGFVSSNAWDVAGAGAFGLDVYWCNRSGASAETIGPAPAHRIATLSDLLKR